MNRACSEGEVKEEQVVAPFPKSGNKTTRCIERKDRNIGTGKVINSVQEEKPKPRKCHDISVVRQLLLVYLASSMQARPHIWKLTPNLRTSTALLALNYIWSFNYGRATEALLTIRYLSLRSCKSHRRVCSCSFSIGTVIIPDYPSPSFPVLAGVEVTSLEGSSVGQAYFEACTVADFGRIDTCPARVLSILGACLASLDIALLAASEDC
jgi:hypothetical protein